MMQLAQCRMRATWKQEGQRCLQTVGQTQASQTLPECQQPPACCGCCICCPPCRLPRLHNHGGALRSRLLSSHHLLDPKPWSILDFAVTRRRSKSMNVQSQKAFTGFWTQAHNLTWPRHGNVQEAAGCTDAVQQGCHRNPDQRQSEGCGQDVPWRLWIRSQSSCQPWSSLLKQRRLWMEHLPLLRGPQ